jgi:uncharacterized protein (DUF952 family)
MSALPAKADIACALTRTCPSKLGPDLSWHLAEHRTVGHPCGLHSEPPAPACTPVPNHDVIGGVNPIYKICTAAEWREAEREGRYRGSAADHKDGFIHFSTAEQAAETAAKWFAGQRDLVLVAVDSDALGDKLKWEPSRGGALFPHLYAPLDVKAVLRVDALPLDETGRHAFPRFYC